jgi:UDP-N-acetylmuramate--alanine ligase
MKTPPVTDPHPAQTDAAVMQAAQAAPGFAGRHVHLLGIGGAGVGALVPLLRAAGATVSGCDAHHSPALARFAQAGIAVAVGHHADHVHGADLVVHTAAVDANHPELAAARAAGIPVITRGACLVALMAGSRTVAIAGSHGKTSTTWMSGHLLAESGRDPLVMVGGSVAALGGGGARAGTGGIFVAETDESDGSCFQVTPDIAVVTNLDHEHLRHYGSYAGLVDAFSAWLARLGAHGTAILPVAGPGSELGRDPRHPLRARVLRCGRDHGDLHYRDLVLGPDGSRGRVIMHGRDLGEITVPLPGAHMALNALMAVAAVRALDPACDLTTLGRCERVRRRFTVHGAPNRIRVVEDYGHHPTEVRATIAAAALAGGRVQVVFQPHRHTRTADSFDDFVAAFDQAHALALLPVYGAGETPIPGADSTALAAALAKRRAAAGHQGPISAPAEAGAALPFIAAHAHPGDTVLVLGAGDVGDLAPTMVLALGHAPTAPQSTAPKAATTDHALAPVAAEVA